MANNPEIITILPIIDAAVLKGVFDNTRQTLDQKWDEFDASDAEFARYALEKANTLGSSDPLLREAYLEGMTDHRAAIFRQQLLDMIKIRFNPDEELKNLEKR
jgi:hypothetical protein